MTWARLAIANLGLSPLTSTVNVVLMGLGTASIVILLLAGEQLASTMARDARGIDLVLGAKGSPVQLVLAAVYHADIPPGNIHQAAANRWAADSRVAAAVPISLGDSYRGARIVGTTPDFLQLYSAELTNGRLWNTPLEAVVGAAAAGTTGLAVRSRFAGAHGIAEGGADHQSDPYEVVGVLAPTGTVVDRLILTSLESVWALHDTHHGEEQDVAHNDHHDTPGERSDDEHHHADEVPSEHGREITAMLIQYQSPLAAMTLPRQINADGAIQAASPAMEISRLLQLVSIGLEGLSAFSWALVLTAALSVFAALYGSLRARRGELAILRCLGATRWELLWILLLEGLLLTLLGVTLGFVAGHGVLELLGTWLEQTRGVTLTGWTWISSETTLLLGLFGVGIIAAAIPAVQAYRTDVAKTLAAGR
jgi:putative ABC transport system permease protein